MRSENVEISLRPEGAAFPRSRSLNGVHWPIILLTVSAMVGPGISYGPLYLYHLVMPLVAIYIFVLTPRDVIIERCRILKWPFRFIAGTLVWYALSIVWARDAQAALRYFAILALCYALIVLLLFMIDDPRKFKILLYTLAAVIGVECIIGLLETFTSFRWPISRFSFHSELFGWPNDLRSLITSERDARYLLSSPTGFHWNPNHFATLLAFAFPFAIIMLPRARAFLFGLILLVLAGAAGARLAFLAMLVMVFLMGFALLRKAIVPLLLLAMVTLFITYGIRSPILQSEKSVETAVMLRQLTGLPPISGNGTGILMEEEEGSPGRRKHASLLAIGSLIDTKGIGLGGGNSRWYLMEHWAEDSEPIADPHNWWVEVLAEGGIPYALFYYGWLVWLWVRIAQRWIRDRNGLFGRISLATAVTMIGAVLAGISPSSMVYFLPLYMLMAIAMLLAFPAILQERPA